jgi:hypothetical protein
MHRSAPLLKALDDQDTQILRDIITQVLMGV